MEKIIYNLEETNRKIYEGFGISEKYYLKTLLESEWAVKKIEGRNFLSYRSEGKEKICVVVNENGNPIIVRKKDFTVVIAINCMKIGFIFKNSLEKSNLEKK